MNDDDHSSLLVDTLDIQAVDVALMALGDPGVTADTDLLQFLTRERAHLEDQERELVRQQISLRDQLSQVTGRLTRAKVHTRLHPYLQGTAVIPHPRDQAERAASGGVPLASILTTDAPMPPSWLERPILHDSDKNMEITQWMRLTRASATYHIPPSRSTTHTNSTMKAKTFRCPRCGPCHHTPFTCPRRHDCFYCGLKGHLPADCWYPHSLCHNYPTCQVSPQHKHAHSLNSCPFRRSHVTEDTDDFDYPYEVDWEAEDRGD